MTTKQKILKAIIWIGFLWFLGLGIYWLITSPVPKTLAARIGGSSEESSIDPTKVPWVMTCDHERGIEIGRPGYIHPDSEVWITGFSERSVSFSRYFSTDRKKGIGMFFWDKANHMEEGSWSQEYPFDHGEWKMEGAPDKGFTGWLTNKDGTKLNFYLTRKGMAPMGKSELVERRRDVPTAHNTKPIEEERPACSHTDHKPDK